MSSIRKWYNPQYRESVTETDKALDKLLHLWSIGISVFWNPDFIHCKSIDEVMENVKKLELNVGDEMFVEYLETKYIPYFKELVNMEIPDHEQLIAHLNYESYILEDELKYCDDESRAALIDAAEYIPYRLIK